MTNRSQIVITKVKNKINNFCKKCRFCGLQNSKKLQFLHYRTRVRPPFETKTAF